MPEKPGTVLLITFFFYSAICDFFNLGDLKSMPHKGKQF